MAYLDLSEKPGRPISRDNLCVSPAAAERIWRCRLEMNRALRRRSSRDEEQRLSSIKPEPLGILEVAELCRFRYVGGGAEFVLHFHELLELFGR